MARVRDILETKGREIHSVEPDDMVLDALKLMAAKDVGSVLVMEGERILGIFTERHYAREVFLKGRASPNTPLRDVMRRDVLHVGPDDTADACVALMTDKRVRHLAVLDGEGQLVGIISIGDLMKAIIGDREFDIDQLVNYVRG
ncbi:MAG: CBS domain-containing protein [Paracoccaceae bacterium]|nr:CBS domain-containing protein [Paracoccaceae bacterium]